MLYDAALDSIAVARRHVQNRNISARTVAINKALRIVMELSHCLNREAGGVISRNLAGLYAYVVRLLVEANSKQIEAPLAEAESLLSTLAAAWKACNPPQLEPSLPNTDPVFRPSDLLPRDAYAGKS